MYNAQNWNKISLQSNEKIQFRYYLFYTVNKRILQYFQFFFARKYFLKNFFSLCLFFVQSFHFHFRFRFFFRRFQFNVLENWHLQNKDTHEQHSPPAVTTKNWRKKNEEQQMLTTILYVHLGSYYKFKIIPKINVAWFLADGMSFCIINRKKSVC